MKVAVGNWRAAIICPCGQMIELPLTKLLVMNASHQEDGHRGYFDNVPVVVKDWQVYLTCRCGCLITFSLSRWLEANAGLPTSPLP